MLLNLVVRRLKQNDIVAAALVVAGIAGLFVFDISQPRGVVDGIGYAAVVALTVRFGPRVLIATAVITTLLTLIAAGLLPNSGISVAGMWANRAFAIASIWIIAFILRHRLALQSHIEEHEVRQRNYQSALARMVNHGLLAEIGFDQRLEQVCRIGVEALDAEGTVVFMRNADDRTADLLCAWRRSAGKPFFQSGHPVNNTPAFRAKLREELVVATDDVELSEFYRGRLPRLRQMDLRAIMVAEVVYGSKRKGVIAFVHEQPHHWLEREIAFGRAVASLVALLIAAQQNSDTLAALDLAGDGLYTEDERGKVTYSNVAARQFSHETEDGPEFPRPAAPLVAERDRHEIACEGRDLEIHRARLPAGGVIARIADVTARNRAEAERGRLEARLHEAAKMEAVGQLASGVSHDFNNILAAISGFAGFIAQDQDAGSENRAFAQRILNACDRGKEVVQQIVTFADTRVVAHSLFDLGRAMKRSQELLTTGMHPGAMLEVELPGEPFWILGNEVQIGRLISNLAGNARDALDGRGGSVEIAAAPAPTEEIETLRGPRGPGEYLFGELGRDTRYVCLRVSDTGSGIAPEIMARVFEPFFTTKGRERGTGLGLAVVQNAIMTHGGACHLKSELGKGTTFSIYLPLAAEGPPGEMPGEAGRPCHVLIVDDEIDMTDLLSIGLERLGFQTVAVQDPLEALAAVEEDPSAFDAVLTDYDMAAMSGTELTRRIKAAAPNVRVVVCTGHQGVSDRAVLGAGADGCLRKPVDIQAVARALSRPAASFSGARTAP